MRISDWSSDVCSSDLSWGWRVPFLASLILVGLGLWIRLHLEETPEFEREAEESEPEERAPISTLFRTQWRSMVLVGGLVAAPLALSHLYQVYALPYLKDRGYDATRSEERRDGKECVSTCRYRWSP